MLTYSEVTLRKYIIFDGEPYEVLASHVFRKQMRKPVNQTKLRHMKTGRVIEHSFHQADKVEEADIGKKTILFLYKNKNEYWFCEENDKSKRFALPEEMVGEAGMFLKTNFPVAALVFEDEVLGVTLPIKMELMVKEAPQAVKGNTVQGGSKQITLETGAIINAPLFIGEGDIIRVNTETKEYVERVEKN